MIVTDFKKYHEKRKATGNEGIENGIYEERADTALHDLKLFQDFLYRNFKNYKVDKKNETSF